MGSGRWQEPPADLALSSGEVHIWRASLDQPAERVQRLGQTLSGDERSRAERFHFERDRLHFIAARGLLRAILGRYSGLEPGQLRFCYGLRGKPALAEAPDGGRLYFNLAHSHGLALYAITREGAIGVDLEYVRHIPEAEQMAERFFSALERDVLRSLPPSQRQVAFFNCWTRKEAYIKAIGDGLLHPLDQFDVSLAPGEPARLLSVAGQEDSHWFIQALTPAPGYVAAVAIEGPVPVSTGEGPPGWRFKYWVF